MPDLDDPSAPGTVMQPIFFVDGQSLELGTPDAERRAALAEWITRPDNTWFSRAFVNRIWSELVGEPFYGAVDDMGPDRTPKAPKTLNLLADAFVESGYDVKWLFQTIALTDAYQRAARPPRLPEETPFLSNTVQRLRADQVVSSLRHALGNEPSGPNRGRGNNNAAVRVGLPADFGFDPSEDRNEVGGSIPQSLAFMNSPNLTRLVALSLQRGSLSQILRAASDESDAIRRMFVQILARPATPQEIDDCLAYLRAAATPSEGYQDIVWALVNSAEFVHRY